MQITVKFFAILRERAGMNEIQIDLPLHDTVAAASARIARELPSIAAMLPRVAFAVNQSYVPTTTELHDGDELAIIPPVSGG
jgi:molybdopterin converting factor subunit 1